MKKWLFLPFVCALSGSVYGQAFQKVGIADLEGLFTAPTDSLLIVNVWATWCRPCIEELPHFEGLKDRFPGQKIKLVLVSVDFPDQESNLEKFLKRKKLKTPVWWLLEDDPNDWIERVHPEWSGALPATIAIVPGQGQKHLAESAFSAQSLDRWVGDLLSIP